MRENNMDTDADVDIELSRATIEAMKTSAQATHGSNVLSNVGDFAGLFKLSDLPPNPILISSTDGIGTKVLLADNGDRWIGIGQDVVNHCINDIMVQGARPLFFLDYIAFDKAYSYRASALVAGMAQACWMAGCALLGGETAEMPGVYREGAYDVAGTIVGLADKDMLLPRRHMMKSKDVLFGIPSSGPHTNGFSLIRQLLEGRNVEEKFLDDLMAPHRSYLGVVNHLEEFGIVIKGLAHITGGGIVDNLPRILPDGLCAMIDRGRWFVPDVFRQLIEWGDISRDESYRVFNMGVGMVVVVGAEQETSIRQALPEVVKIGELAKSDRPVPDVVFTDL